jgi:hypothetical protein
MARIAAEAVADVFPQKKNPSETEREILRRVEQRTDAAAGLAGAGAVAADPAAVRLAVSRSVVDTEFAWLKEYKEPPQVRDASGYYEPSAYWVSPYLRDSVKARLGLTRPAAAEPAPEGPGESDAPPIPPGR